VLLGTTLLVNLLLGRGERSLFTISINGEGIAELRLLVKRPVEVDSY
jgi:hypothetical protein